MVGMLWFDKNPNGSLEERVRSAIEHYFRTRERTAKFCLVCPKDAEGADLKALSKLFGLDVSAERFVLKRHLIVGEEKWS